MTNARIDDTRLTTRCSVCHGKFTPAEWDERHEDEDGLDCHEECCPICKAIDTAVAQRLAEVRGAAT
jgi:hypothetical protein